MASCSPFDLPLRILRSCDGAVRTHDYGARMTAAKRPTINDVARAAGVTKGTASKALAPNGDRYQVSAVTRERVLAAARDLGFALADKAGKRHDRIALLFLGEAPNLDGINLGLHVALTEHLRRKRLDVVYQSMDRGSDDARRRALARVDGCLLVSRTPVLEREWTSWLAELRDLPPAVALNAGIRLPIPQVEPDDAGGAAALLARLLEQGHRRVAVVGRRHQPTPQHGSHHLRHAALVAGARAAGCEFNDWTDVEDAQVVRRLALLGDEAPTVLIGLSGWRFPELWGALMRAGVLMPRRLALATCDDPPFNAQMAPAVTGLTWSMPTLVEVALATLDVVLSGGQPTALTLVPQQVVERESTSGWQRA